LTDRVQKVIVRGYRRQSGSVI